MSASSDKKTKKLTEKQEKRVTVFLNKNKAVAQRFKSLIQYIEKASPPELDAFFNEHFYVIYSVFLDAFSLFENTCKKKTSMIQLC